MKLKNESERGTRVESTRCGHGDVSLLCPEAKPVKDYIC